MQTLICQDYKEMSQKAAAMVIEILQKKPDAFISFPGGDSPVGMIKEFVAAVNQKVVDISKAKFVSLDEWVGLDQTDYGSCAYFLKTHLFDKLSVSFFDTFILNGKAEDIEQERKNHMAFFEKYGPLDLSVLGIGMNGHLGFNESGVDFHLSSHIIPLDPITKKVMHKYFKKDYPLTHGITQGICQIMDSHTVIVLADGIKKAEIIKKAIKGDITNQIPASILQNHKNCYYIIEKEAASLL